MRPPGWFAHVMPRNGAVQDERATHDDVRTLDTIPTARGSTPRRGAKLLND